MGVGPLLLRGKLNVLNSLLTLRKRALENSCFASHLGIRAEEIQRK